MNDKEFYKSYIEAKMSGKRMADLAKKFGITRTYIYPRVKEIEEGNKEKVERCIHQSRLNCLWENRYSIFYEALPKNREKETVEKLKKIIQDMYNDGFKVNDIARLLGKTHTTIMHHLEKR